MDYPGWPSVIKRVLKIGREREQRRSECCNMRRTQSATGVLKMEEEDHEPRNVGHLWKLEKARELTLPLSFKKGMQPC